MRKNPFAQAAALLVMLTGSALAADLPLKAEPVAPRFSWTGCYLGAHVGGGRGSKDMTDPVALVQDTLNGTPVTAGITTVTTNPTGAVIGGEIGCDYQFAGNAVIGIEGTASGTTMRGSSFVGLPAATAAGFPGEFALVQANNDFLASVTGRIGYAFDTVLLYGRGGFAVAGDKYDVSGGDFAGLGPFHFQGADNRYGWVVGGGVDWAFTPHWSMNVEYDFYHFGSGGILMTDQFSSLTGVVDVKQTVQVIKVGFNFHIWASGR
jgi:outer membrane immunogenic protein